MPDQPEAPATPWPDWLADLTPEDRVRAIADAVAECYGDHQCQGKADHFRESAGGQHCTVGVAGDLLLRLLGEARQQAPVPSADLASLRERIDVALERSLYSCPRCKVCDAQLDAIMAVLAAEPESRSGQGGEGDHAEAVRIAQENAGPGVRVFWHAGGLCYHPERAPQGGNLAAEVPSEPVMDLLETAWAVIAGAGWNDPESSGYQLSPRLVNWELAAETWRRRYQVLVAEYAAAKIATAPYGGEPEHRDGFCSLCGNTNVADLGATIGICLDGEACRYRQSALMRNARERDIARADAAEQRGRIARAVSCIAELTGDAVTPGAAHHLTAVLTNSPPTAAGPPATP